MRLQQGADRAAKSAILKITDLVASAGNQRQPSEQFSERHLKRLACHICNPHTIRDTLAMLGEKVCATPEEFKAWSQTFAMNRSLRHSPMGTSRNMGKTKF